MVNLVGVLKKSEFHEMIENKKMNKNTSFVKEARKNINVVKESRRKTVIEHIAVSYFFNLNRSCNPFFQSKIQSVLF